jgi:hypothetical protein
MATFPKMNIFMVCHEYCVIVKKGGLLQKSNLADTGL